ncbi:MAG: class I SAM-dependent methyltransferase [Minwuia sp.]|nr:class I SAM-dependent methyltransferase [Minwuia sp.]
MPKVALKNRIKAWWDGYPIDAQSGAVTGTRRRDTEVIRRHCPYGPLADTHGLLFGQGYHQPGGTDFLFRMIGTHVPLQEQKAMVLGCGSGGMCRDLAERFNLRVQGLDPDRELLRCGMEMIRDTMRGKAVRLGPIDLKHMELGIAKYQLVVAREILHTQADRHEIYERVEKILRRTGRMVFTQLVADDDADADSLSLDLRTSLEPKDYVYLTREEERRCLVESGLDVAMEEDVTDELLKHTISVFADWQRAVETMASYIEQPKMLQELVRIVDHWQRRSDAMKNGNLRVILFHAAKRTNEPVAEPPESA